MKKIDLSYISKVCWIVCEFQLCILISFFASPLPDSGNDTAQLLDSVLIRHLFLCTQMSGCCPSFLIGNGTTPMLMEIRSKSALHCISAALIREHHEHTQAKCLADPLQGCRTDWMHFKDEGLQIITNDRAYLAGIKLNQNVRTGQADLLRWNK